MLLFSGILDKSIPASIPRWVSDCMLLTAVFNSCINPIIYGWYYYKDKGGGTNTRLGVTKYNLFSRNNVTLTMNNILNHPKE